MDHMNSDVIYKKISETINVMDIIRSDRKMILTIEKIVNICLAALKNGRKIMFIGNGGSAADAQHLAAEFVSRFAIDRKGLAAIALTTDSSILTAISNDYGFDQLFARQIESIGVEGDVLVAISTSGKSSNVLTGISVAKNKNISVIGLTGEEGFAMSSKCDVTICIPSNNTAHIQEAHIVIGHIICGLVENEYTSNVETHESAAV